MGFFDYLPESIVVGGTEIPIHWDFRASIAFESVIQDPRVKPEEQLYRLLELYFDREVLPLINNLGERGYAEDFLNAVFDFYKCGKTVGTIGKDMSKRPAYSFEHDAERIYAAFLEQYGMDLYTVKNLHWWKFRAMFSNLSDTCEIVRIMQIRTKELEPGMTAKERRALKKAKSIYALPDLRTQEQIEADFVDGFSAMF